MKRKYKAWTNSEMRIVREFVETSEHPWSRYETYALAKRLGVTFDQARGAVNRAFRAVREERR